MALERRPLLPARSRRPTAVIAVLCLAAVVALGVKFAGETHAGPVDEAAFALFNRWPRFAGTLSYTTSPIAMIVIIAVIAAIAVKLRRPKVALLAVLAPALGAAVNSWVLKPIFDRTKDDTLAYPSGHTTTLVAILAVITLVVAANAPARTAVAVGVTALALVAVGAGAIVGKEYHYLTDTLGALFWGVAVVIVLAASIDAVSDRMRSRTSEAHVAITPSGD